MRLLLSLALALGACAPGPQAPADRSFQPEPQRPLVADSGSTTANDDGAERGSGLRRLARGQHGVTTRRAALEVRRRPQMRAGADRLRMTNPIDQGLVLLIAGTRAGSEEDWFEVLVPNRPNGSTGWVRASDVRVVRLRHRIEIDLSTYTLEHFRGNKRVHRFVVGIGQDRYPTPRGTYYVWAKVPQPSPTGPYGMYALGISGFSPVLSDWPGGGRAAVHGTADAADKGSKISHGCIRVFNEDMKKLTGVPMGTPVVIKR